ncbi:MAG TPA: hypothetical protein VIY49_09975 [Bryobacteraceae bacterium]
MARFGQTFLGGKRTAKGNGCIEQMKELCVYAADRDLLGVRSSSQIHQFEPAGSRILENFVVLTPKGNDLRTLR